MDIVTLALAKKYADEKLTNIDGSSSTQSDWNQNDETALDYIKNRPFYADESLGTVLFGDTVTFTANGTINYLYEFSSEITLVIGRCYRVIFDEVVYDNLIAYDPWDSGSKIIGNSGYTTEALDSGEYPFQITTQSIRISLNNGDSHSISIVDMSTAYVMLPKEYVSYKPGMVVEKQTFNIDGEEVVAGVCAEIFNNLAENKATGRYSHAEGCDTTASSDYQHVQGKYNIEDTADTYAHIVGNGTNNDQRSNAHTLDWEGNAWYQGDVYVGSNSGVIKDEGSKKLATEDFVSEKFNQLSQEKVDQKELENYVLKDEIPTVPVQSVNGKTGAVQLSASEVGALPNSTKIPANTSDLTNNSGFITKTVTDLANYYLKTEVYTQEEIDNKLSAIPKFAIEVVSTLPTANISETTVYLIASGNEEHNLYTEYIYVDGQWEYLGKQTVDLTNYVKRAELSNYYLKSEMDSLLTTIRNSIPTQLSQFTEDSTHRTVTDTEKKTWNAKSNFSGAYGDLTGKPTIPTKTSQLTNDSNFVDKSVTDKLSQEKVDQTDAVLVIPQTLTDDQKAQARTNIGAASTAEVSQLSQEKVNGTGIKNIVKMTQDEYDAMESHDSKTLYVIEG